MVQKATLDEIISAQEFATKQDLIAAKVEIKQDIAELKYNLLKWQLGIGFALVVIMAKGFGWLGF